MVRRNHGGRLAHLAAGGVARGWLQVGVVPLIGAPRTIRIGWSRGVDTGRADCCSGRNGGPRNMASHIRRTAAGAIVPAGSFTAHDDCRRARHSRLSERRPRCTEGPIPVQCRSCSCGTCWVGVLDGADLLSPVDAKERATISALGYLDTDDSKPIVRLACMARPTVQITLVIPPWNGQIGARLEKAGAADVE